MIQRVMMPAMVKKTEGAKGTYFVFSKTLSLIISVLLPLTLFLILFSKQIVLVLLGKRWLDAVPLLQIFFLNLPLRTTASLGDTLLRVHGFIKLNLLRKVQNSIIICILIYVGYLVDGLTGIAWGIFISTIISYIMMMAIIRASSSVNSRSGGAVSSMGSATISRMLSCTIVADPTYTNRYSNSPFDAARWIPFRPAPLMVRARNSWLMAGSTVLVRIASIIRPPLSTSVQRPTISFTASSS